MDSVLFKMTSRSGPGEGTAAALLASSDRKSKITVWRARATVAAVAFIVVVAAAILAGHETGLSSSLGESPHPGPSARSSAIVLLLTAVGLTLLAVYRWRGQWRGYAMAAWVVVSLAGLWQLASFAAGVGVKVPMWEPQDVTAPPLVGAGFAAGGALVFWSLCSRRFLRFAAWLSLGVLGIGMLLFLGYATGVPFLYGSPWQPPGLGLSLGVAGIGVSLMAIIGLDYSPLKAFTRSSVTGRLLRRFVPMVVILMITYALLTNEARARLPIHPVIVEFALTIVMVTAIGLVVAQSARRIGVEIDRAQREKAEAQRKLRQLNAELEERVNERTKSLQAVNGELREAVDRTRDAEREAVEVAAREHKRIGEYLHDNIGQLMTGIGFLSQGLEQRLKKREAAETEMAAEIRGLAVQVLSETRHISRGFFAVSLESHGFGYAMEQLGEFFRKTYGVECTYSEPPTLPSLDSNTVTNLYRIAQEAINNAIKHGDAEKIEFTVKTDGTKGALSVWNDGHPFSQKDQSEGIGLSIMKQRAAAIGGDITIRTVEDGVKVICRFPLEL